MICKFVHSRKLQVRFFIQSWLLMLLLSSIFSWKLNEDVGQGHLHRFDKNVAQRSGKSWRAVHARTRRWQAIFVLSA